MSSIIVFNSGATPQNVLQFIPSNADPSSYIGRQDVLIDPSLSPVSGIPQIYWKVSGNSLVPMTAQEKSDVDAAIAAGALSVERAGAISSFESTDASGAILRAIGSVLVDEVNLIREWFVSFQAAVAASTNLANLQTRVAALPNMPDRTIAQFKTAIQSKINSGAVDS